eukprot:scaffold12220_cov204-Skeletonema_marinoi.AAC.3
MSYASNDALYSIQTDICKYNGNFKVRLVGLCNQEGWSRLSSKRCPTSGMGGMLHWTSCYIEADLDERSDH